MTFIPGADYTRLEIYNALGGNVQTYLPVKNGQVVAACLRLDINPGAPNIILCGTGLRIRHAGLRLAQQRSPLPIFIKQAPTRWTYQGLFKVTGSCTDPEECAPYITDSGRDPAEISRVVLLEAVTVL